MSKDAIGFKKEMSKARWIMWMRVWWGSVAFTVGIMCLVIAGLFLEAFSANIWFVSGFIGAILISIGFYFIATC